MYLWHSLLVWCGLLSYMSRNPRPISQVSDGIVWCCIMLWLSVWFISVFFHCPIIQSLCAWAHWSFLTLFCFLNSGLLTAILPDGPASQSLLLKVDVDSFFFTTLVHLCCSYPSVTQADLIVVSSCCYFRSTALVLILFCPISWCLLTT